MLDDKIEVRVNSQDKKKFIDKCKEKGTKYQEEIRKFIKRGK